MIRRVVAIKLKSEHRTGDQRRLVAQHTKEVLPDVEGGRSLEIWLPGDGRTGREWDICLLLTFDDIEAVEKYRVDSVHRAYADDYLKPIMDKIRVWNFEVV